MNFKTITGLIGLIVLVAFLIPPVIKIQKLSLVIVALIGVGLAAYEFYETLHSKDE